MALQGLDRLGNRITSTSVQRKMRWMDPPTDHRAVPLAAQATDKLAVVIDRSIGRPGFVEFDEA